MPAGDRVEPTAAGGRGHPFVGRVPRRRRGARRRGASRGPERAPRPTPTASTSTYTVEGEGPPLVLLHGASSSAIEDWAHQRSLFRQSFTCYLVDARGHAGTRWDASGGWSRDTLVEDLGAFADAMDLDTFHRGRLLDGSHDGHSPSPPAGRSGCGARIVAGIDVESEPRTSIARAADGPGAHRARGAGLGGPAGAATRAGPGRRRMAASDARDGRGRRRSPTPLTPAELRHGEAARSCSRTATVTSGCRWSTRSRCVASSRTRACSWRPTAPTSSSSASRRCSTPRRSGSGGRSGPIDGEGPALRHSGRYGSLG